MMFKNYRRALVKQPHRSLLSYLRVNSAVTWSAPGPLMVQVCQISHTFHDLCIWQACHLSARLRYNLRHWQGNETIWLRYQIASQENRTLVFASSPGSFWHFAICKHYQRAFHTCLGTEVRASSWQVESNTLCHKDFQSKSIQLCYIKSTLHPQPAWQMKRNQTNIKFSFKSPLELTSTTIGQPVFR